MKTMTMCTTVICVLTCAISRAELWPSLPEYIKSCDLIVLCETEMAEDKPVFKITEQWKGEYKPTDFNKYLQARIPKPGYLPAGLGLHSGRKSQPRQEVIFCFTQVKVRKYDGSSTSFDVRDGKLVYAETGDPGVPKEYTLNDLGRRS
jgi:hypothetical protein